MNLLRRVALAVTASFLLGGIAVGQERTAGDLSCAFWLQEAEKAKRFKSSTLMWPSTQVESQQLLNELAAAAEARGFRAGYAVGVFATIPMGPRSHIRDSAEFVTSLDTLCAGAPYKKLIDVALHVLGRR